MRSKLGRIDEKADDEKISSPSTFPHEAEVPLVKEAHGGDESNRLPCPSGLGRKLLHLFDRLEDFHFSDSVDLFRPHWNEIPGALAHLFDFA